MNRTEAKTLITQILAAIAPEANLTVLSGRVQLRDELDLDSMDFLNFITALHERTKMTIPEADYPRLGTLDGAIDCLAR